jgi:ATP-binding cassette, subfamily B, bacterial MsbA
MKNFPRALRFSWTYRRSLMLSLVCAAVAAIFWGLNFTAIYPVLKIMGSDQNLQQWVDKKISNLNRDVDALTKDLEQHRAFAKQVENWDLDSLRQRESARVAGTIVQLESRLETVTSHLWRYQQLRSSVIRHLPEDRFETLALVLGVVMIGVMIRGVFEFGQEYLVGSVMIRTLYDIRTQFYRHVLHQDLQQFSDTGSAELMARFTNDTEVVGNGIKILFGRVIAEPLRAMACIGIACWISWQLTLLFLILIPAALYIMTNTSKYMKRATRKVLERMSSIYKIVQESSQGIRVVKAFTMEPYERRRFNKASKDYSDRTLRVVTIDALAGPLVEILGVAAVIVALLAGAYLVLNRQTELFGIPMTSGPIEMETLIQIFGLLAATADPVRKLSSVYNKLQSADAAADRIFAIWDRPATITANPNGTILERHKTAIEFRNICFSYQSTRPILENISFTVKAGETIAIVGPNGCGKSTLLSMLPRFYDPDHGNIYVDGVDVREANLRSVRKQISIVTQDTILFDDTIRNNIAYGKRDASQEAIEEAAKKAFVHDFIVTKLPLGYDTPAGEVGKNFSGGEKQRLAFARAILRDPSILILDEFTSQIDPVDELLIHQALKEFKVGRTTFMITHKVHTLEIADRIVMMDRGRIEAIGTHEELFRDSEKYRKLFEGHMQLKVA